MNSSRAVLTDFDGCAEAVSRICRPYRLADPSSREFRGSVRNFTAASLNITELCLGRSRMTQDPEGPTSGGAHYYSLVAQLRGTARVLHRKMDVCLGPGDLVLLDSGRPAVVEVSEGSMQYAVNLFQPSDLARLASLRSACGRAIAHADGPTAVLTDTLLSVAKNADRLGGLDLRSHTIDLMLAAFDLPGRESASGDAIIGYIDTHLHQPTLDPRQIAFYFGISLRQLYRVTAHEATPAALIWQRRLQRAKQLLAIDKRASITEIAYRCGFKDSAHFARAYRGRYGVAPSQARHDMGGYCRMEPDDAGETT
jgi:AraC family transcriptional regulator, positive regulator of tynA and feaB